MRRVVCVGNVNAGGTSNFKIHISLTGDANDTSVQCFENVCKSAIRICNKNDDF